MVTTITIRTYILSVSIQAWEILIEDESERIPTIKAVFEVVLALLEELSPVVRGARGWYIFWSSKVDHLAPSYVERPKVPIWKDAVCRWWEFTNEAELETATEDGIFGFKTGVKATHMHTATLIPHIICTYEVSVRVQRLTRSTIRNIDHTCVYYHV